MTTPDLERLARETAEKIDYVGDLEAKVANERIILSALRTAQQSATANEDTAELKQLRETIRKAMTAFCEDASDGKAAAKMFTILASAAIDQARREGA